MNCLSLNTRSPEQQLIGARRWELTVAIVRKTMERVRCSVSVAHEKRGGE